MSVERQLAAWAATRTDIPADEIAKVEFDHYDEHHYSELTWEPAYDAAIVTRVDGGTVTISLGGEEFGDLIAEILSAGVNP